MQDILSRHEARGDSTPHVLFAAIEKSEDFLLPAERRKIPHLLSAAFSPMDGARMCTPEKARQGLVEIAVQAHNRKERRFCPAASPSFSPGRGKEAAREQEHLERVKKQRGQVGGRPVEPWKGHWAHQTSKKN